MIKDRNLQRQANSKLVYDLSNDAIFNDLERLQTQKRIRDIVTMEY